MTEESIKKLRAKVLLYGIMERGVSINQALLNVSRLEYVLMGAEKITPQELDAIEYLTSKQFSEEEISQAEHVYKILTGKAYAKDVFRLIASNIPSKD